MALFNPNKKLQALADTLVKARRPYDKDMLLNLAFYLDEQYAEWKDDTSTIRRIPRDDRFLNTPRPVVNKLMHFANQSHAQALQAKPTVDVLPATDDAEDITYSGVGKAYLTWLAEPQVEGFEGKLSDAVFWAVVAGPGYLKWTFDADKKRPCISVPSPLDIYLDPYISNFYDARYLLHRRFMDPEQVYDLYGVETKSDSTEQMDPVRAELMRSMGYTTTTTGVMVNELWYKPCRRYKDGLFCVWAGREQLVQPGPHPYDHKQLPITQLGVIPRPGSAYYHSALKYMRPAQMELNKYHAQRIMIREGFANPKYFIDSELAESLNSLPDDTPRQVMIGDSRGGSVKPEIIQPTGMADNNEGAWIGEEMMHIVGLHEVSQGQVPGRVESSKAIEMLKDADVSRLAELGRTIDMSISIGFWQSLMLAKQYVPGESIVEVYSREGLPEVLKFKAEKFKPGMRIRVTRGTGLARSRAARQEQLLLLWQNQVIQDPQLMAELMELPIPTFIRATSFDIKLAKSENYTLAGNAAIQPNSWDDHEVHIREHNNFRKTQEFFTLKDEIKTKFEHHVTTHEDLQIQQLQKQIEKQILMQQATGQVPTDPAAQTPPGASPTDPAAAGADAGTPPAAPGA